MKFGNTTQSLFALAGISLLLSGAFFMIDTSSEVSIIFQALLFWIYALAPGCVAFFYASREKIHLPVFLQWNRYFYLTILAGSGIRFLAFLGTLLLAALFFPQEL